MPRNPRAMFSLTPLVPLLLALVLAGCGGGGGAVPIEEPAPPLLDLGLHASTVPTRIEIDFDNPLAAQATVTAGTASGPFALDPADLPATAPSGGSVALGILFTPVKEGVSTGLITVVFEAGSDRQQKQYTVQAEGEKVRWTLSPPSLDYGAVEVGESRELQVIVLNLSNLSPVTFTGASVPPPHFTLLGAAFPVDLDPGESATFSVRFEPISGGIHDGTLTLGPDDPGGGVEVPLLAEGIGGGSEVITDFGEVDIDSSKRTPYLSVSVPADAVSLFIEGEADGGITVKTIGLDSLTGPGGKVYENSSSTGAYTWSEGWYVFTTQIPNTDRSDLQLVPGGGTYQFRLKLLSGLANTVRVRAIVERRGDGSGASTVLPLNVWLANGISVNAGNAATDTRLQAVLDRIDQILSQQGIRLGDIDYYNVSNSAYDEVTSESEFFTMLKTTSGASEVRLNLFFVKTALGGGVVGVSATIAGPKLNGTSVSGVMSIYEGYTTSTIGLIAAHELGHFLGLYHTVEQNGSHDFIDDTANCPASGSNTTCPTPGGGLLMHWQAVGGSDITDGQGLVLRGHPHMEPTGSGSTKPVILQALLQSELSPLPEDWCGTCRRRHDKEQD